MFRNIMLIKKNNPFKIGQKVLVIDFDMDKNKEVLRKGEVIAKRQRLELNPSIWVYLVKLDSDKIKVFEEQQVWLAGYQNETTK